MWLGRWGSSAVSGYIADARARSVEGASIWRGALKGLSDDQPGAGADARWAPMQTFLATGVPAQDAKAAPPPTNFLLYKPRRCLHVICSHGQTLCDWAFDVDDPNIETDPHSVMTGRDWKGKPCTKCLRRTPKRPGSSQAPEAEVILSSSSESASESDSLDT